MPLPKLLCAKFGPKRDLQQSWPWKVKNGTIRFLDLKNIDLDAKIIVISALVQKLWSKTSFWIMVGNITRSCMSHIQTDQDILILLKGPAPSYLVLKFDNILPVNNWVVAQSVILHRVMTLKDQGHRSKTNSTIRFLDLKNIDLDTKIVMLHALVPKLWSKTSFCIMVANVTCFAYVTHSNRSRYFFHSLKGPYPSYLVLKFSIILPINNWDMAQNVILIRSWPWKVKIIGQNKWCQHKGFHSSYLVLKLATFYPLRTEIYPEMWFCKVMTLKGQGHRQNKWHHQIPWPQKHRSRHQNRHPKCLSSKVMAKDISLHNGGQRNAFVYVTHSNRSRHFFIYRKALTQAILC